ncbi:PREDICTED: LOW QUALITY PROTEIN: repetin-like [Acromyrmex echinatior]|uniref:LOW QUALITY PROTEIN: repetin-like n=1 Tax=Acromyrmex echinatior TaxID=103372 RepID=UPI000581023E|nr:PREDICTED: LOW QUALITY PROTEIN: repetin-like [Acromyrmex echinatior]
MAIGRIIVLSALIAQALSAPSGCIETCNFLQTNVRQTLGSYQDHANLVQGTTHLNDHDYTRPGNWTEHNQYNTDSGHGKVHEERGQYVEGSKRVRYYKKNFTSSYGTDNVHGVNAAELGELSGQHRYDSLHVPSNQHLDSQSAYDLGQTVIKETGYNRVHSQQTDSLSTRLNSKSEKLEDFGEYDGYSQVNQHIPSTNTHAIDTQHNVETVPNNWSRADSYRTDGGRGQVFEEEGQYVTGPKKVRYYQKNYTSSYSSGVPQSSGSSVKLDELHNEMQRNLQKDLDNFRRTFQVSSTGHTASTTHVGSTQEAVGIHDLQTAENDYRQHLGYRGVPSTGSVHHYTDQQQRETLTDIRQPYSYPTAATNTYDTESHRAYQSHETHASRVHPVPQSSHSSLGYLQVPRDSFQTNYHNTHSSGRHLDDTRHTDVLGTHQSNVLQNQLLTQENSQRVYNPHSSHPTYPSRHAWSSSSHGGSVAPERTIADHSRHSVGHAERAHYDRDAYNEHHGRYHTAQGYESRARTSGSSYDSGYRANSAQLVAGSLDLGHAAHGADCTEETHQQYQHETRYHRKYKRDAYHGNAQEHQAVENEDFTQQNQEFGQESQQLKDLTQQSEQFTQQTQGSDDFTQQTSGKLELGQQTIDNQHLDDSKQQSEQFTQQTEAQLEFGQQTVNNPHLEDLTQQSEQFTQQTQGSDDFTQQTSGKLELGQQTVDNQHLDDLKQQSEQFTQQTEGQLEFGQQTVNNPHLENLTQQSEQFTQQTQRSNDFTQQTSGKLEFGQQTVDNQRLDNLKQQSEQFTQQTEGQLEFGQQTVNNPHLENLTQQNEQFTQEIQGHDHLTQQTSGKLELGQQTIDSQHLTQQSEQLTQQTEGQLEFGQQTVDNPHLKDLTQQNEQFTQQTQRLDHFTQTSGKLEFGQQTVDNHHLDDLTQQSEQFTQQTEGQLEFGQQTVDNPHLKDLTQQDSDGFSQQTSGKLEYGQQISNNQHLEDLMQQNQQFTQGSDDFTQQTSGKIIFGQQANDTQQLEQFTQRTARSDSLTQQIQLGKHEFGQQINNQHLEDPLRQSEQFAQTLRSDDFTQQSVGKLEFGQQTQSINKPAKPKSQRLEEFNEQNQDFTQQTGGFDDFTQQIGHLEFGQLQQPKDSNHHLEDFAQQNEDLTQQTGGFDDFSQQTAGHLYGQQREQQQRPSWPGHNTQHLKHYSQQNDWNTDDLSQQSRQYSAYNKNNKQLEWQLEQTNFERDFLQQTDQDQITTNVKPAPKPKPRPRYQKHDSIPPRTDRTDTIIDDVFKPVEVNPEPDIDNFRGRIIESGSRATYPESNHHTSTILYSTQGSNAFHNQRENIDRLHWVHNSNDATVGLQWHYTYHPSDLTNVEGSHDNYYPRHNVNSMSQQTEDTQQQFKPIDFHQQETQDKDRLENKHQNSYISQSSEHDEYNQQSESQQSETFRFDDQFNQDSEQTARVIPLQRNEKTQLILEQEKRSVSTTEQTENKPESRILQAYGGGPYASRSDDFYIRIRPNPSATLPPIDGDDSWDIREKPREAIIPRSTVHNTQEYITTTEVAETTTEITQTTIQPSFWSRVGHKITSTYDKAKEKAKEIFG